MRKGLHYLILIFYFILTSFPVISQNKLKDTTVFASLFHAAYSYQIPAGDLAKRFGGNSAIGGGFTIKTKGNWLFGAEGNYFFSSNIKEDSILKHISTHDGYIIDGDGNYAYVHVYERGWNATVKAGKLFPVFGPNPNSGIAITLGLTFLEHKIRIENEGNTAPQLAPEYRRGYDRLTNGIGMTQFIGYMYLGNNKLINFFAGLEFTEAWTKNRRPFNFDTMSKDNSNRFDMLSGIKLGWIIPIYKRVPPKYYYY
jgi:hypothetical protein